MNQIQPTHDYMAPIQTAPAMLLHPNYDNEPIAPYRSNDRVFDVAPPGTEPPPPGFENEPINRYSDEREWNAHNVNEKERPSVRTPDQKGIATPATPPESRERHGFNNEPIPAANTRERRTISPRQPANERERTRGNATDDRSKERRRHSRSPARRDAAKRDNREESRHERDKKDYEKAHRGREREKERTIREPTRDVIDRKERHEKETKRESSDDEKREKRAKDKKKKKKEEKLLEKKKKKERKEKEKREKKAHSRDKSHNKDTAITCTGKTEEQRDEAISDNKKHENTVEALADPRSCTPPPPLSMQQPVQSATDQEVDVEQSVAQTETKVNEDDSNIDLYGDITSRNIEYPYEGADAVADEEIVSSGSPLQMNHLDSILDIHANLDFDENEMNEIETEPTIKRTVNDVFAPIPELSKWERDDELGADKKIGGDLLPDTADHNQVTTEVLKRAENAIFARAINAIRPIEIKKISAERQKLYSNEKQEDEPTLLGTENMKNELESFQITVPVHSEQAERSVEIKSNKRNKTPIKSVKERLGRIVSDDLRSRSKTPPRKIVVDANKDRRSRSRERRERSTGRGSRCDKDSGKRDASNDRRNNRKEDSRGRRRDSSRDGRNDRDAIGNEKRDNSDRRDNRGGRSNRDSRDNRGSRDNRREENKSRERDVARNVGRDEHRRQMEKNTRDIIRERDLDKAREMARVRERERVKELELKTASADGSSAKPTADNEKSKDKKNVNSDRNRSERSAKPSSGETKNDDQKVDSGRNKASASTNPFERKKPGIDEAHFVPDYDENMGEENQTADTSKKSGKTTESKSTAPVAKKRTRSESASSSSSDSNSSGSESESEDRKRKKRKHKKQKKSKRASSSGSDDSTSKKKKRKSKKSKKKKKTKK